ncbi:flagellar hook-length control protein FliK [Cellvibrio sp. pealriver]|uniref:flagellar hook-length control protein FliK n=1 Tax=Cellvibrio sp. pealriver TaxID=1622269 RepID=UPI00066FBEBC|nr:flagellar hook-length control protein FliK [Cellvibrio sp. pealriver]
MELSSITDKLVQNLQRAQVESIVAITKALGLKTGSQFLADVGKATQASPEERAQLVKAIEANLAQVNRNSAAPAIKALVNQLLEQKNLAQTPGVKLVNLTITAPTTSAPNTATTPAVPIQLLSYTSLPLQSGQTLLMQLADNQRLQILQVLTKSEAAAVVTLLQTSNPQGASAGTALLSTPSPLNLPAGTSSPSTTGTLTYTLAGMASSPPVNPLQHGDNNTVTAKPAVSPQAMEAISDTLRRLLPQKDQGQDLMTALPKITQFIQQLPIAERKEWMSNQLQQSLKTLANHIRTADQLSNPKLVEMALKNNGQGFEHKLAQLAIKSPEAAAIAKTGTSSAATASTSKTNTSTAGVTSGLTNPIQKNVLSQAALEQKLISQKPVAHIANQDLKGALLSVLHQLDGELETTSPLATSISTSSELSKTQLANVLPQFLGMLMHRQQGELSQKQLRTQLVMLMHQYTLGSLTKIQLQQAHTLNHQITQGNDIAQPTQSWQFEIPVRSGQDVTPLQIHLEQQWVEEQSDEKAQTATRVRQWNVMLGFNLPVIGQFYAQLTLLGDQLSARFWAENENTLVAAKNKMDELKTQLEQEGIHVTQMQCIPGLPPKPKLNLSYSLVDVKT